MNINFADAIPQIFVTSSLYQSRAQNIHIPGYDRISAGLYSCLLKNKAIQLRRDQKNCKKKMVFLSVIFYWLVTDLNYSYNFCLFVK